MQRTFLLLISAIILSGCNLIPAQPYIQTYYFDVGTPETAIKSNHQNIDITEVKRSGPYCERMVFRTSPNSVRFDEFNRWSMLPDEMIKRYLEMVYTCEADHQKEKIYSLQAEIVQLEADLANNKVLVGINFELYTADNNNKIWEKTFSQQISVQKVTGESFAKAAQHGIDNIIKELDMHLTSNIK